MCSRYSLTSPAEAVRAYFGYRNSAEFPPRYNIAPTQPVGIVRLNQRAEREFVLVRWGLLPPWVKDLNARSETAAEKPSFRGAMRHRRCLVPADGFYEWTGKPGAKRPHFIRPKGGGVMGFAGLWEHWLGADGCELETMAILTTQANATMSAIHDRMPVILQPSQFEMWVDCRDGSAAGIEDFLRPAADDLLEIIEVNPKVNNSRNEGPDLQVPAGKAML
jgi:putative SOS response-associated peptidase YedK